MDEQRWLACDEPQPMLKYLLNASNWEEPSAERTVQRWHGCVSERKLRLLACGLARQVWSHLKHKSLRAAVEVAERYADSATYAEELVFAREVAERSISGAMARTEFANELAYKCAGGIPVLTDNSGLMRWFSVSTKYAEAQADLIREVFGNPFRRPPGDEPVAKMYVCEKCGERSRLLFEQYRFCRSCHSDHVRKLRQRDLWFTPEVTSVVQECYDSRDWSSLHVAADALRDAGCDDENLLEHLAGYECPHCKDADFRTGDGGMPMYGGKEPEATRAANYWAGRCVCKGTRRLAYKHTLGCWAADLILQKE